MRASSLGPLDSAPALRDSVRMGLAMRLFLVHDDDSLERLALSRFERLYGRRDPKARLPEHAGKRLRYALFLLRTDTDGADIVRADYGFMQLDARGRHASGSHHEEIRDAFALLDRAPLSGAAEPNVLGVKEFRQRRFKVTHTWTPGDALARALRAALAGVRAPDRRPPRRLSLVPPSLD